MAATILGLDIGGANLKAATADRRAASVPFPLWKQPDKLPAALAELVAKFPDADELAVTMTGELCDCFETKREGVHAILSAVEDAAGGRPVWVWSTDGKFIQPFEARTESRYMKVAAANWHALASFAGRRLQPKGGAILLDIGSTTTDIIPVLDGVPVPQGKTDYDRLFTSELLYTGVRRTPLCAILSSRGAAELFATTHDVYLVLGLVPEEPDNCETADGRPATKSRAGERLRRMYCADRDTMPQEDVQRLAEGILEQQRNQIQSCYRQAEWHLSGLGAKEEAVPIVSGEGEFLARLALNLRQDSPFHGHMLTALFGKTIATCAPAYALTQLPKPKRRP